MAEERLLKMENKSKEITQMQYREKLMKPVNEKSCPLQ